MKQWVFALIPVLLSGVMLTSGCRKAPDLVANNNNNPASNDTTKIVVAQDTTAGKMQVCFAPTVNGMPLIMDSAWYQNAAGDSFRVTDYQYYVSNFVLESDSGKQVALPETYMLVNARKPQIRAISNIPAGTYQKITFLLGVDSARNVSGAQTGDLEQSQGMFWDWNAGYIMSKLEGFSPQSTLSEKSFFFHIAGFSGKNSVLRTVTLSFPVPLKIAAGSAPTLQLQSDVASWFSGNTPFSFADHSSVMSVGPDAIAIANNYSKGFSIVRIDP